MSTVQRAIRVTKGAKVRMTQDEEKWICREDIRVVTEVIIIRTLVLEHKNSVNKSYPPLLMLSAEKKEGVGERRSEQKNSGILPFILSFLSDPLPYL